MRPGPSDLFNRAVYLGGGLAMRGFFETTSHRWLRRVVEPLRSRLKKSRLIVFTAILGGRDTLKDPTVITPGCRYLCFTDEPLRSEIWEIHRVPSEDDSRLASRYFKILAHRVLETEFSLWVDGSFRINVNAWSMVDRYLRHADIAAFAHHNLDCVYADMRESIEFGLGDADGLARQMQRYRSQGLPDGDGMWNCGVILRRHTSVIAQLNEAWWREISSARDQPGFKYCTWRLGIPVAAIEGHTLRDAHFEYLDHRSQRLASEFDPDQWKALSPPPCVAAFPGDLTNTALEYSGVYPDGWLSDSVLLGIGQPFKRATFIVRGMVPLLDDPAFSTELTVLVDGKERLRRRIGLGEFELRLAAPEIEGRCRVHLHFSDWQQLPEEHPRLVAALAQFIGFEETAASEDSGSAPSDSEPPPAQTSCDPVVRAAPATHRPTARQAAGRTVLSSERCKGTCFCTLAIGSPYRRMAQQLCASATTVPWAVLTDAPEDFAALSVRAVQHAPTGPMAVDYLEMKYLESQPTSGDDRGAAAYHDKRFAILSALNGFDTALYLDADSRLAALPPFPAFPPGLAVVHRGNGCISQHLEKYGSWRKPHFVDLATYLTGSAEILDAAWWCSEAMMAITRDGRESRFFAAWSLAAAFMQSRGVYSGEGGVIGLAAAYAGWQVDFDALAKLAAAVEHEGGGPRAD